MVTIGLRILPDARLLDLRRDALLFRRMREDHRAVLRADIGSLAVELRRVVHLEEQVEQFFVSNFGGIERHFHDFGMVGRAAAYLAIVGIGDMPPA